MSQATNTNIDEKEYLETMSRSRNAIEVYERTKKNSVGTKKTQISHKEAIGLLMEISNMSKEEAESIYRSIYKRKHQRYKRPRNQRWPSP